MRRRVFVRTLIADLLLIVLFAAVGRRNHNESSALVGTLVTAAPFMIGYVVAVVVTRLDRAPLSVARAAMAWAPGVALGMVLRGTVFDRGTARPFVVVAFVATGVLLLGWRLAALFVRRRRPARR